MTIAVILPTYNEAESIGSMIDRVRAVNSGYQIYVADSGSNDGTLEIAKSKGAKLIVLDKRGKGIAIKKAFDTIENEIVILLDSDTSYAPEEIPKLLHALESCDVVVGSRFAGSIAEGSMKPINKLGNIALTTIAKTLYGKPVSDVCSGFWAFNRKAYKGMEINAAHFELEANFYVECAKKNFKLCEVPISYVNRVGQTKLNIFHGANIGGYLIAKKLFE